MSTVDSPILSQPFTERSGTRTGEPSLALSDRRALSVGGNPALPRRLREADTLGPGFSTPPDLPQVRGPSTPPGWRPQENRRQRRLFEDGSGTFGGSRHSGRSRVSVALDVQERAQIGGRTQPAWPSDPVIGWWPSCCMNWAIACRPTARPWKGPAMPTATSNSSTSTSMSPSFSSSSSPSFQSIPRRKELVGNFKNHGAELRPKRRPGTSARA